MMCYPTCLPFLQIKAAEQSLRGSRKVILCKKYFLIFIWIHRLVLDRFRNMETCMRITPGEIFGFADIAPGVNLYSSISDTGQISLDYA